MPLATATITGVSHKLGTSIARPGVVRATYLGGAYIDDDAANTLISGVAEATVQADGSFSLVLPAGFVYSFTFTGEDSDPGWTVGPAQVDASAALDDLVLATAPDDTKSTYQHITGLTGAATWNITYDSLVVECTLTGDATVTLTQTGEPNYRIVRIIPTLAGHTLTVAGIAITGATTLEHLTSGWVTAGTPATPDTTDPSQPGVATVTPTADGYDLAWGAASDNIGVTGYEGAIDGGSYADYGPDLAQTITGLIAGSTHSGTVRAYDAAGNRGTTRAWGPSQVTPAAPGWTTIIDDTFTGASSSALDGRTPDTATLSGATWTKGTGWLANHDAGMEEMLLTGSGTFKATNAAQTGNTSYWVSLGALPTGIEVSWTQDVHAQANTQLGRSRVSIGNMQITRQTSGALAVSCGAGNAVPTITGSMTAAASSTITVRFVDHALTILVDGVEVGTGTTSWTESPGYVELFLVNWGASFGDRFTVKKLA